MKKEINLFNKEEAREEAEKIKEKKSLGLAEDYGSAEKMVELEERVKNDEHEASGLFRNFNTKLEEVSKLIMADFVKAGPQIENLKRQFGRINKKYGQSQLGILEKDFFKYLEELENAKETIESIQGQREYFTQKVLEEIKNFETSQEADGFNPKEVNTKDSVDTIELLNNFLEHLQNLRSGSKSMENTSQKISEQRHIDAMLKRLRKFQYKIRKNDKTTEDALKKKIKTKMNSLIEEVEKFKEKL